MSASDATERLVQMAVDRSELCPFHCRCQEAADEIERLREALGRIAGKNDLSGIPNEKLESAARYALYECEMIAREVLSPHEPSGVAE